MTSLHSAPIRRCAKDLETYVANSKQKRQSSGSPLNAKGRGNSTPRPQVTRTRSHRWRSLRIGRLEEQTRRQQPRVPHARDLVAQRLPRPFEGDRASLARCGCCPCVRAAEHRRHGDAAQLGLGPINWALIFLSAKNGFRRADGFRPDSE